ncbi:hypothetical protein CARUB_v10006154mg [Capsella rubella]|uniref:Uncharacterized protein n=1 Tax=Capsella rubella TaxID=81985 RepID=R0GZL4_9BRAS|nr:uncharacterized protein LOC17880864 [Capsella rubella]EOA17764.1 hypothetical protein CARUB_v10006154mg [Capsella rubella]EOA17765.1 hypothetical protein CARUB_v10006154mg [Capsella rubella]
MKKSGIIAASISVAASATAISAGSTNTSVSFSSPESNLSRQDTKEKQRKKKGSEDGGDEKFAPRFDGLRFIETLVTAHR